MEVVIHVNDKAPIVKKAFTKSTTVDCELGKLNIGDTIYVGIGPDGNDAYDAFSLDFTIAQGSAASSGAAPLGKEKATLVAEIDPEQAEVYLDGKLVSASSPKELNLEVSPGKHELKVEKRGFKPHTQTLDLTGISVKYVTVKLEPISSPPSGKATLVLEIEPDECDVYLDGKLANFTASRKVISIELSPDKHELKVKKRGYKPYTETVDLTGIAQKKVTVKLEPTDTPSEAYRAEKSAAQSVINDGGFVVVKVISGGNEVTARVLAELPNEAFVMRQINFHGKGYIQNNNIVPLKHLKHVTHLWLSGTEVNDDGLAHIAGYGELERLYLGGAVKITDNGLRHVGNLRNLRFLGIVYTKATNAGMVHLRKLSRLEEINVAGTKISDAGVHRYLPKCKVSRNK